MTEALTEWSGKPNVRGELKGLHSAPSCVQPTRCEDLLSVYVLVLVYFPVFSVAVSRPAEMSALSPGVWFMICCNKRMLCWKMQESFWVRDRLFSPDVFAAGFASKETAYATLLKSKGISNCATEAYRAPFQPGFMVSGCGGFTATNPSQHQTGP